MSNETYKKLYESATNNLLMVQTELIKRDTIIGTMRKLLDQAQENVNLNKEINRNAIADYNEKQQRYIELIHSLKHLCRELGYNGDFSELG